MAKMTLADRLAAALTHIGCVEQPKQGKYRKFSHVDPEKKGKIWFFVGKSGALRSGKNATTSISLTDGHFYKGLLAATEEPQS